MVLEFFASIAAGLAMLGVALLLNRLTGNRLGRWLAPAAVAAGMLAYTVWSEYSWAGRSLETGIYTEAAREEARVWYRPWSWLVPQTSRLIVLDRRFTRVHPDQPDLVLTRVVRLERWIPESGYLAVFDCAAGAQAPLTERVQLLEDGAVEGADWAVLPQGDPLLRAACAAGEELRNGHTSGA